MKKKFIFWLARRVRVKLVDPANLKYAVRSGRATGNTTRLADEHIQILFHLGTVTATDHHPGRQASKRLFYIIVARLKAEHPNQVFQIDRNKLTITL